MNARRIAWSIVGLLSLYTVARAGPVERELTGKATRGSNPDKLINYVSEVAQLTPSDASDTLGQGFGDSAAIDGDWIAVGAERDSQVDYSSGAVYLFRRDDSGWVEHVKLVPDDGAWEGFFGGSLAMDRDRLVVGASVNGSTEEGPRLAYVFTRDDNGTPRELSDDRWVQQDKLLIPVEMLPSLPCCCCDGASGVGIAGDRIVIGAGRATYLGFVGFAAIFEREEGQWKYLAYLLGSDSVPGDHFGFPVAIIGHRVVVGASNANGGTGEVYVFRSIRGEWIEETQLSSIAPGNLGRPLSFDRNYLVVSGYSTTGGSVSVFHRVGRTWVQQADLLAPDPTVERLFGGSVFIQGKRLFVSAADRDENFGVLYFFERVGTQWLERQRLVPSDVSPSAGFGGVRGQSGRYLVASGALKVYVLQLDR